MSIKELVIRITIAAIIALAVWLPIAVSLHLEHKQFHNKSNKNSYILRMPKFVFYLGLVSGVLFFSFFLLAVFVSDDLAGYGFIPFCILAMLLMIYAIRWKIIVRGDQLDIYRVLKPPCSVSIFDIERVVQAQNGIAAYIGDKKIFTLETLAVGYELLYTRLDELGKMESTLSKGSFSVRRSKGEPVIGGLGFLFFFGILIWAVMEPGDASIFLIVTVFGGFSLFSVYLLIAYFRWKLVVEGDMLIYRTPLGRESTILFSSIERVRVKKHFVHLICNGKTIIKVEPGYKGYAILIERLQAEQIPFYYKNKKLEMES